MRIQLELPEARVDALKALMKETGVETYKEYINNALTFLDWGIAEVKAGHVIASLDEEKERYRILLMPILERVSKHPQKSPPV